MKQPHSLCLISLAPSGAFFFLKSQSCVALRCCLCVLRIVATLTNGRFKMQATSPDPKFAHIDAADKGKIIANIAEGEAWLEATQQKQVCCLPPFHTSMFLDSQPQSLTSLFEDIVVFFLCLLRYLTIFFYEPILWARPLKTILSFLCSNRIFNLALFHV